MAQRDPSLTFVLISLLASNFQSATNTIVVLEARVAPSVLLMSKQDGEDKQFYSSLLALRRWVGLARRLDGNSNQMIWHKLSKLASVSSLGRDNVIATIVSEPSWLTKHQSPRDDRGRTLALAR